jgi:hypothetical protein
VTVSNWHPIKPEHAIEVMGVVISLREPLPTLLQRRVFKETEEIAFASGLRSRHVLTDRLFTIGSEIQIPTQASSIPATTGYIFNAMAEEDLQSPEGRPPQTVEQVEVRPNMIVYRTWRYVSWKWNFERIKKLMVPYFAVARDVALLATLRLEYLDRFVSDGEPNDADYKSLIRGGSKYVAPHVYDNPTLWHSHAGLLVEDKNHVQRIMQVHLDTADGLLGDMPARSVGVLTALEDRFGVDAEAIDTDMLCATLDGMHARLKIVLAEVISAEQVSRIHLQD